jgi:hypothetical protein
MGVEDLVRLISANTYCLAALRAHTYRCFKLAARVPGLREVRIVMSFEQGRLTGHSVALVSNRIGCSGASSR